MMLDTRGISEISFCSSNGDTATGGTGGFSDPWLYIVAPYYISGGTNVCQMHYPSSNTTVRSYSVSFREQMRRMKQSLNEIRTAPNYAPDSRQQIRANPSQGRHGRQMSYRLPGYRAKRTA